MTTTQDIMRLARNCAGARPGAGEHIFSALESAVEALITERDALRATVYTDNSATLVTTKQNTDTLEKRLLALAFANFGTNNELADALTEAATMLDALRARLEQAEKQEPVATDFFKTLPHGQNLDGVEPEQRGPVGTLNISRYKGHLVNHNFDYYGELPDGTYPLYTSPAPQPAALQPLTDEELGAMWVAARRNSPVPHVVFARAIEAAHGIGAKPAPACGVCQGSGVTGIHQKCVCQYGANP